MTEIPPYLFILTSTALVLGVAITVRGLLGFRPLAEDAALPAPAVDGISFDPQVVEASAEVEAIMSAPVDAVASAKPIESAGPADATLASEAAAPTEATEFTEPTELPPTPPVVGTARDLREPLVMTIAGILICLFTILGIAALVNSA